MKKILMVLVAFSLLAGSNVLADDLAEVKKIVSESIEVAIGLIKDKSIDKETRDKKIIEAVAPFFDFDFMAKICLGKKGWMEMSPENRKVYLDRFVERLQESFLEKLDLYTDEEVVVDQAKKVKNRIYVVTHLVSSDDKMEMIFKFRETEKGWLVYDMEILGVSVVQTYRSQFAGYLKDHSPDELVERLKSKGSFTVPTGKQ